MTSIGLQPIRMRDAILHVEADSYEQSINQVIFIPSYDVEWTDLYDDPNRLPFLGRHHWSVALGYVQDLATPGSLSTYLIEHAAQQRTVTFTVPGMVVAATVLLVPGRFGGTIGQIPVATVSLPLYGDPDLSPVAA